MKLREYKIEVLFMLSLIALLFILGGCTLTISDGGNGTGTGNPVILGKVYKAEGTPASHVKAMLRRKDFLKDTSLAQLKKMYVDSADTFTDNDGVFCFTSVNTGQYLIEVASEDSISVLLECEVKKGDSIISIPTDTLALMKKITGTVSLHGGPKAKRFVQVYGLDRVVETDTTGYFQIILPSGEFKLKVVISTSEYKAVDIPNINPGSAPLSIKVLSETPIADSWECDTLIIRAILDSNGLNMVSADSVIDGIDSGRVNSINLGLPMVNIIPSILGGLHTLEDLEIRKTLVSRLPERIGELINITDLKLDSNKLTTLPLEITNLLLLEELDLSYNKLKNLLPAVKAWADKYDPDWAATQDTTVVVK